MVNLPDRLPAAFSDRTHVPVTVTLTEIEVVTNPSLPGVVLTGLDVETLTSALRIQLAGMDVETLVEEAPPDPDDDPKSDQDTVTIVVSAAPEDPPLVPGLYCVRNGGWVLIQLGVPL